MPRRFLPHTYSMKIEMTEKQYYEIRKALISAQVELEWSLADAEANKLKCLAAHARERLDEINSALASSSCENLKISY